MSSKKFLIINWEKISELWIYIYLKSFAAILSYIYIKHVWIRTDPQYCPFNPCLTPRSSLEQESGLVEDLRTNLEATEQRRTEQVPTVGLEPRLLINLFKKPPN